MSDAAGDGPARTAGQPSAAPDIRAVFLDAGGTLIHLDRAFILERLAEQGILGDAAGYAAAVRAAGEAVLRIMGDGHAADDATRWRHYILALLGALGCEGEAAQTMGEALRRRHAEGLLWTHVEPGVPEALEALRGRGYTLGVVSNADGRVADFLDRAGLLGFFDFVLDSARVGVEKPDPRIFRLACERAGVEAGQAVHVGDIYEIDVVGARRAGVTPLLIDPGDLHTGPDCERIRAIDELPGWLAARTPLAAGSGRLSA